MSELFLAHRPQLGDYWRAIVLFGRNVASYKFALAKALLELQPHAGQVTKLEDLALPFAKHIAHHLQTADRQATSASSKFLEACRQFNQGQLSEFRLVEQTVRLGFTNVIDAFHVVGPKEIPIRFFLDERRANAGIRLSEEFAQLVESVQAANLPFEVEARWRLVETAWELGVSRNLLTIEFDLGSEGLVALDQSRRRKAVTSCRDALNGYQKGKCFYCFVDIALAGVMSAPDVDHFFPHALKQFNFGPLVDGVWNLVLACRECNRGVGGKGKSARVPTVKLLERLWRRNEFLIASHHPLQETLFLQTGGTEAARRNFLKTWHSGALAALIHQWEPEQQAPASF